MQEVPHQIMLFFSIHPVHLHDQDRWLGSSFRGSDQGSAGSDREERIIQKRSCKNLVAYTGKTTSGLHNYSNSCDFGGVNGHDYVNFRGPEDYWYFALLLTQCFASILASGIFTFPSYGLDKSSNSTLSSYQINENTNIIAYFITLIIYFISAYENCFIQRKL